MCLVWKIIGFDIHSNPGPKHLGSFECKNCATFSALRPSTCDQYRMRTDTLEVVETGKPSEDMFSHGHTSGHDPDNGDDVEPELLTRVNELDDYSGNGNEAEQEYVENGRPKCIFKPNSR